MPFGVYLPSGEQSTYIISFVSHVGTTLATLQALTSFWPFAHSSHLGFIGVGREGGGKALLTSSALFHTLECFLPLCRLLLLSALMLTAAI